MAVIAVASTALAACSSPPNAEGIAAAVNGDPITASSIEDELATIAANEDYRRALERDTSIPVLGETEGSFSSVFVARVVGANVLDRLVRQTLDDLGVDISDDARDLARKDVIDQIAGRDVRLAEAVFKDFPSAYRDVLVDRTAALLTLQAELSDLPLRPDDDDVEAFVSENPEPFDVVCARHQAFATRDLADERAGEALASEVECAPIGTYTGQGLPALDAELRRIEDGQAGGPVQTVLGWHLVERVETRPPDPESLISDAKLVMAELAAETFDRWLEAALATSDIVIDARFGSWDPDRLIVVPRGVS